MKFLCVDCDAQMTSVEQRSPGDGTLALVFRCPECEREVAMLANPMETQMVNSLCVKVGPTGSRAGPTAAGEPGGGMEAADAAGAAHPGGPVSGPPFGMVRSRLRPGEAGQKAEGAPGPAWNADAEARLARVPGFVRGMVRQLYAEWAWQRGIAEITPDVMDRARGDLDLEGV